MLGESLLGGAGDDIVDGVARRHALAQRKGHRWLRGRSALLKTGRSLLVLGREETVRTKGLVEGVRGVEAHEWELFRKCGVHTCRATDSGGKRKRCERDATRS